MSSTTYGSTTATGRAGGTGALRGQRGRERSAERETRRRAAATGAAQEEEGPSRASLAGGDPSDLQRMEEMRVDVAGAFPTSNSVSGA
jgi:hypothetical protein